MIRLLFFNKFFRFEYKSFDSLFSCCCCGCHFFHMKVIFLPGKDRDSNLSSCRELIISSAKAVDELITGLPKEGALTLALSIMAARDELHTALRSLSSWKQQVAEESRSSAASDMSAEDEMLTKEGATTHCAVRNRVVSKMVYSFHPDVSSKGSPHWVWCAFILCYSFKCAQIMYDLL